MMKGTTRFWLTMFLLAAIPLAAPAGATQNRNPSECGDGDASRPCDCESDGDSVGDGCIKVTLGMGRTTPWTGSRRLALKVFADDRSPLVFTPGTLHAVAGWTFMRLGPAVMADGATPREVVLSHPNGEPVRFVFAEGESLGRPDPGTHVPTDERLQMVDARGWATARDPVYWDLYLGDGRVRRFAATAAAGGLGRLVHERGPRGAVTTPADMGIDVVYGPDGVRQFLSPSRLADVRLAAGGGYDVAVYPLEAPPARDAATGLYAVPSAAPSAYLTVRPAEGGNRAVVTLRTGGGEPRGYVFDYAAGDWSLTRPDGVRDLKDRTATDSEAARLASEVRAPTGELLSRTVMHYRWEPWGYAMTNRVEGFGGVTRTTSWDYVAVGDGKGRVRSRLDPSGLLTEYAYDAQARETLARRSGPGMPVEETLTSYEPVDPADDLLPSDSRPRTVVRRVDGIEVGRTYCAYTPTADVVERAATPGATYGATGALRTVTAYYPVAEGDPRSGLVRSVRREDGRLDLYDYALETNVWTETVTHVREDAPEPVEGRTVREVTVTDALGRVPESRTEAFVGGAWRTVARERRAYDAAGRIVRTEDLAGRVTAAAWDCCRKVSETRPDGSAVTWDYDSEGRATEVSRLVARDAADVAWVSTRYAYDGLGRQVAAWTTNLAAQVGLPPETVAYDPLGRVAARTNAPGGVTRTEYAADGRGTVVTEPNGATTQTALAADGFALSVTGTAATPEFRSRGVLPDGTRWTRVAYGETADSPRFEVRFEDALGRTVRVERGGFGGATLATVYDYDGFGRLVRVAADGEPAVMYAYGAAGERVSTTRTAGAEWRRTETDSRYALVDGEVWRVTTNVVSCSDAAIPPLVTSSAVRLTGLSAANPLRRVAVDARGNATEEWTAFAEGTLSEFRRVPGASNAAETRLRLGAEVLSVSASSVTNATAYDALGRVAATANGRGNVSRVEYDGFGRRSATIDAAGNATRYGYDADGSLVAVTNALGGVTVYGYDLRGNRTCEGGATYPVRREYDIFGNVTSMTTYRDEASGSGDVTRWVYDAATGAVTGKTYADGRGPSYAYDANGRLTRRTWARGVVTDYAYDGWGNLTNTAYSDGTPSVALCYDAMGRLAEARDAAGVTVFAYDAFGSVTNEMRNGESILRAYDRFGRLAALDGTVYGYDDGTGRLVSVVDGTDRFAYAYLSGTDFVSGWSCGEFAHTTAFEPKRDLVAAVTNRFGNTVVSSFGYVNDAAGRRTAIRRGGSAFGDLAGAVDAYGYNVRSEVVSVRRTLGGDVLPDREETFAYDPIGNRTGSSAAGTDTAYAANALNQYARVETEGNSFEPQYDADGNQTLVETPTGRWAVGWNAENRPVRWTCGDKVLLMSYDRMGRRVRYVETTGGSTNKVATFLYDGYLCIARTVDGTTDRFLWDPTEPVATRPLAMVADGTIYLYTHDANKNVSELVNARTGETAAHYDYSVFGKMLIATGFLRNRNPFRFSSEYVDDATGLTYYNYRHYDPVHGRWLSRDFVDKWVIANLYTMMGNDVLMDCDYLGRMRWGDIKNALDSIRSLYDKLISAYESFSQCIGKLKQWGLQQKEITGELVNDKLFHCWASCDIGMDCGTSASVFLGVLKEFGDRMGAYKDLIEDFFEWDLNLTDFKDRIEDSELDEDADMWGIQCHENGLDCECCCTERYKRF